MIAHVVFMCGVGRMEGIVGGMTLRERAIVVVLFFLK